MNARLTSVERPLALHSPARLDSVAVIEASAWQEPANPWITFVLVAVGTFMIMLDASIVNISLASIARTFHTPVGGAIEWIIIAYLVTIASTLLTFGRLSDMVGRKPVWLSGLALFTLGSGVCGAANSLSLLIAARAFQGLGALLLSTSVAIITNSFSFDKRGFALGCNAVVIALGASAGPALGGFITEHWSWPWIFYVNIPIGIGKKFPPEKFNSASLCHYKRRLACVQGPRRPIAWSSLCEQGIVPLSRACRPHQGNSTVPEIASSSCLLGL
jgi:MFS family permease